MVGFSGAPYVVLANLRKMPGVDHSAVGGGVFGSLPSGGTRSALLSVSGQLVIARGDQRPHAPKCRAYLPGVPCNTSTTRLRSVEAAHAPRCAQARECCITLATGYNHADIIIEVM